MIPPKAGGMWREAPWRQRRSLIPTIIPLEAGLVGMALVVNWWNYLYLITDLSGAEGQTKMCADQVHIFVLDRDKRFYDRSDHISL